MFYSALVLLVLLGTVSFVYNYKINRENDKIDVTNYCRTLTDSLSTALKQLSAGEKQYLASGDPTALNLINDAIKKVNIWSKNIAVPKLSYLNSILYDQQFLSELSERTITTQKNIELKKSNLFSLTPVDYNYAVTEIMDSRINTHLDAIRALNQNTYSGAEETKRDYRNYLQFWTISIALFLLTFIFTTAYYVKKYRLHTIARETVLQYNSSLIKNINDPIITTDANYFISNWNSYAEDLFGYTEAEARGKHMGKFLKVEYPHTAIPEMMEFFVTEKDWRGEAIYHHKDGTALEVEVSSSIIKTASNKHDGTIAVIRNVTDRNLLHKKLEKFSDELQQQVTKKTGELTVVFERVADAFLALDNDWNYTYINKKAAQLHGILPSRMMGTKITDEDPGITTRPFFKCLEKAKATQKQQRIELYYDKTHSWYEALIYPDAEGLSVYFRNITERISTQHNLQRIHDRLQYYIQSTPLAVLEIDSMEKIILWNKRAEQMFGWTAEEAIGKTLPELNIVNNVNLPAVAGNNSASKVLVEQEIIKNSNITKDGKSISCQWYNSIQIDDQGKVLGTMSLAEDITNRENMESNLHEAEAKFRNLVEQSMVGVYIIQDEKLVYVNPTFAKIFGYDPSDFLDFDHIMIVYPTDRDKVASNIRSRIRKDVNSINYQFKGITKQGEAIMVEVFGSFTVYNGKPSIIGSIIDITQRIEFINQLEKNRLAEKLLNERFLLAAKATNDAVWDWDITNNELWGNQVFCSFMGVTDPESFKTEQFMDMVHPDDRDPLIKNLQFALKNKITLVEEEFRFKMHGKNHVIIHDKAYIIYDEHGRGVRMLGAFHDITEKRKNEQRIMIEKELSDSIINSLPGIFYLFNKKGKLKRWNRNFEEVTLYSKQELETLNMQNLFEANMLLEIKPKITSIFTGGEGDIVTQIKNKNGDCIDYQLNGRFINYEGEDCLLGVGIDISERTKMQNQLIESEEKYRTLIEQASDGIFITDTTGAFISVNTSITLLTGYTKAEILKLGVKELLLKANLKDAPKIENLRHGESVITERVLAKKNGERSPVEVSYKLLADGRLQGIVRDITSRKAAEEALRISEIKYRILFDKNPLPMFILSTSTQKFLDVNAAALNFYGFTKEEFVQKNLFDLMSNDENPIVLKNFGALIRNIQKGGVYNHFTKDGTKVHVNTIIHDIMYDGQVAKLIVAADETEKIEAADNLKASHESLRQLATHLENIREAERTHMAREIHDELGQQLTGLKMDISWLSRRINVEDDIISQKVKDIIQLIDKTVVTVRRLATELRPSILDDLGLVSAMEWQSEEFEKRSEIKSVFTTNDPSVVVKSETATNIFRIFQESLTNVLRHANATEVKSRLTANENELELEIVDNGQGFNMTGIEGKKTLGLLGMKERVHIMGGTCNIFSKPGHGTVVKILVPITDESV